MSSTQKKRKSANGAREREKGSSSKRNQSEGTGSSSSNNGRSSSDDSDDEKQLGKRRVADAERQSSRVSRLCLLFVVIMCLVFYDMAMVHTAIYSETVAVPARGIVDEASRKSRRKYHQDNLGVIVEDTKKIETLLIKTGTVDKPNMATETLRISRVLRGESDDSDGEGEAAALFKAASDVQDMEHTVKNRIGKRSGKVSFLVSKAGYNLDALSLASVKDIHDGKRLADFVERATEHAMEAEEAIEPKSKAASKAALAVADEGEEEASGEASEGPAKPQPVRLNRKMAFERREPDAAFLKFVEELRSDNTYAHLGRKNDMERALKVLGYKQSTKSGKKVPLWVGYEDKGKCPVFKREETRISFCPYYIPQNKADQFAHITNFADKVPASKLKPDFYPLTWRLYKEQDRRSLKLHCTNESMSEFGEAYVRKFTVPGSNYMKSAESIYDQLVKSDKKVKELTKETKNRAIVQHYINNPLLLEERKFIMRTFAVIVNAKPLIVYYHDGAVFRSIVKYKPFARHDSDYKKAAHITSEQKSAQKKVLKSSELYTSFNSLQNYLKREQVVDDNYVNKVLRPQMKARMIYALYAILKRQRASDDDPAAAEEAPERSESLVNNAAVVQTTCFDFLLDDKKKLYLITVATAQHCFINMGGNSFKPAWKTKMQEALSDSTAKLSEEMLWRRMNNKPVSSMKFFTQTDMTVLIDETFPDWDLTKEINAHVEGVQVEQDNHDYSAAAENDEEELDHGAGASGGGPEDDGDEDDGSPPEEDEEEEP